MGMDIFLVEYLGKRDDGYLKTKSASKEYDWDSRRLTVRHRFSKEVEQDELHSGIYMDPKALYRPSNFKKAFSWADTLNDGEKEYVKKILTTLESNTNLYLEYSF